MNRLDVREKARAITELTADDVTDTVIDMYMRDGYERIMNMERRWPWLEASTTITVTAGDSEVAMTDFAGDLREVVSLVHADTGWALDLVGYEQADAVWQNTTSGRPQHWSLWASNVKLWPTPDVDYTFRVRGYRKAVAWYDADAVEIDADERLHTAIVYYVVAKLYQLQEDVEMSNSYAMAFADAVSSAHKEIMRPSSMRPLVLNQGVGFGPNSFARFI